jgi:hypothetical protein
MKQVRPQRHPSVRTGQKELVMEVTHYDPIVGIPSVYLPIPHGGFKVCAALACLPLIAYFLVGTGFGLLWVFLALILVPTLCWMPVFGTGLVSWFGEYWARNVRGNEVHFLVPGLPPVPRDPKIETPTTPMEIHRRHTSAYGYRIILPLGGWFTEASIKMPGHSVWKIRGHSDNDSWKSLKVQFRDGEGDGLTLRIKDAVELLHQMGTFTLRFSSQIREMMQENQRLGILAELARERELIIYDAIMEIHHSRRYTKSKAGHAIKLQMTRRLIGTLDPESVRRKGLQGLLDEWEKSAVVSPENVQDPARVS